jgi:hypothetical protein
MPPATFRLRITPDCVAWLADKQLYGFLSSH